MRAAIGGRFLAFRGTLGQKDVFGCAEIRGPKVPFPFIATPFPLC